MQSLMKNALFLIIFQFLSVPSHALNLAQMYLKYNSEGKTQSAQKSLSQWQPKSFEEESYKKYFTALNENKVESYWLLYQQLAQSHKLIKLQHESIQKILEIAVVSKVDPTRKIKKFARTAKNMLKVMRGQPEGVEYELTYLKWILKNKNFRELCGTERSRWLSQTSLNLSEVMQGLERCEMTYNDFIYRIRMLIFAGEENQAKKELDDFVEKRKLEDWKKAYLQAVYFTNIGDPTAAFDIVAPYSEQIKKSEEYYDNLFFIAQRAGELQKAEEIINNIILDSKLKPKEKRDFVFQKAFLFYQTRRYKEAIPILNTLIATNRTHWKKVKNLEYDDLTWLRAWCYYLNKDYEKARDALMDNRKWARDKARNMYWLAQSEWTLDDQVKSVMLFRQLARPVIDGKFFSYYNYMGWLKFQAYKSFAAPEFIRSRLNSLKSRGPYALPDFTINPLDLIKEYKTYFEDVGATDEGNIQIINSDEVAVDDDSDKGIKTETSEQLKSEMSWADDLRKWGYADLAKWHLYDVEKSIGRRDQAEALSRYYLDKEYYNRAVSLMNSRVGVSDKKLNLKDEPLLWRSIFPKAYEKNVKTEADKRDLSPYLLWSIMKAETQFKPDAISPVGAVGLMQFMPYTSQKVALLLGETHKIDNMFEPDIAIRYGARYLKKLADELGNQLPLIAAAYNGGPHRVKLWLRNLQQDDGSNMEYDEFIEHIPFNETRTYVKRVLSFYLSYQKIYDDKLDYDSTKWLIDKNPFKPKAPIVLKEEWPFDEASLKR